MSSSSCCARTERLPRRLAAAAALFVLLCVAVLLPARADGWRDDLPQARLSGEGELRWFGLRIYRAALWSAQSRFDPAQPFALELTYQRSISRARIVQTSMEEIRRLSGDRYSEEQLKRWEAQMLDAFTDVSAGDQLTGVYLPHIGCRFYNRTQLLAEIRDPEFARAFFAIWLDPRSKDSQLRNRLLGAEEK